MEINTHLNKINKPNKSPGNHSDQEDKLTENRKVHGKLGNSQTVKTTHLLWKKTSQFGD